MKILRYSHISFSLYSCLASLDGNEVDNERIFIGGSNVKTFTRETDEKDVQALVQVTEESKKTTFSIFLMNFHWTFKNLTTSKGNPIWIK